MEQINESPKPADGNQKFKLTRRIFLDVLSNRIAAFYFEPNSYNSGLTMAIPDKDRLGRRKVILSINSDASVEEQLYALAHETVHIERSPWDQPRNVPTSSYEYRGAEMEEERIADEAAAVFCKTSRSLISKGLTHLKLRAVKDDQIT